MINNDYIINQVENEYNALTSKIEQDKFNNERILYKNNEYSDISYKLRAVIFDLQKAKFLKNIEEVKNLELQKVELERQKIAIEKKLSLKLPKIQYKCNICKDKGYIEENLCHCRYEKITDTIYKFLEIHKTHFSTFEQDTLSSVNDQEKLFEKLKHYANNFSLNSKNLVFTGDPGRGKTFFAMAIADIVSKKDFVVLYLTAFDFNQILLKYHLAKSYEKSIYYDILTNCDLLVIDDLGAEPIYQNVTIEYTLSIISQRLNLSKPFIITTNLDFDYIASKYDVRLVSRLKSKNVVKLGFKGKDLR